MVGIQGLGSGSLVDPDPGKLYYPPHLKEIVTNTPPSLTLSLYFYCSLEDPCPLHRDRDPFIFKWKNGRGKTHSTLADGLQSNPEIRVTVKQF